MSNYNDLKNTVEIAKSLGILEERLAERQHRIDILTARCAELESQLRIEAAETTKRMDRINDLENKLAVYENAAKDARECAEKCGNFNESNYVNGEDMGWEDHATPIIAAFASKQVGPWRERLMMVVHELGLHHDKMSHLPSTCDVCQLISTTCAMIDDSLRVTPPAPTEGQQAKEGV